MNPSKPKLSTGHVMQEGRTYPPDEGHVELTGCYQQLFLVLLIFAVVFVLSAVWVGL